MDTQTIEATEAETTERLSRRNIYGSLSGNVPSDVRERMAQEISAAGDQEAARAVRGDLTTADLEIPARLITRAIDFSAMRQMYGRVLPHLSDATLLEFSEAIKWDRAAWLDGWKSKAYAEALARMIVTPL